MSDNELVSMTLPKGKVVHDHHHRKDRERAKYLHLLSLASAFLFAALLMLA